MVFLPPSWVPSLPDPPDSITIEQFIRDPTYGRLPASQSLDPYTCGLSGQTFSASQVFERVDFLSRAISKRLAFDLNEGTEWDRVVGLYSFNTIDYVPFTHAVHRLSGIVTPANASYSPSELEHQLRSSGARALFTCAPLLQNALKAAKAVGIPKEKIFLLPMPNGERKDGFKTVDDLVEEGRNLEKIPEVRMIKGQGKRQVAFLCYSSGTSGLPKAVMLTHHNIISNILQWHTHELPHRTSHRIVTQTSLGLLPLGHIYGLTLVAHVAQYRGDRVIILPQFELASFLRAVQRYRIELLNVVPPVLIAMMNNKKKCDEFDLSSVRYVNSGAAPLGEETMKGMKREFPAWNIGQAYGMTEASPAVTSTSELDPLPGSSGSLLAGTRVKLVDPTTGNEITTYDTRGEMLVQGPNVVRGYLNNEKANAETFVWHEDGPWLRTGDEVVVKKSEKGHEHWFVVDRIKELIKVKGFQVAPAELEAHILDHPSISDCAVIAVPLPSQGEAPRAYVVKSPSASSKPDEEVAREVSKHVQDHKAHYKWLKGGVEFVDAIPKSASGKILRRVLKEMDKERRRGEGAKI